MAVNLGFQPVNITVTLPSDADFVSEFVAATAWAAGTQIELWFLPDMGGAPMVWAATVSGTTATWDVPADEVATVITAAPYWVRLHYADALTGSELLWGIGRVVVV